MEQKPTVPNGTSSPVPDPEESIVCAPEDMIVGEDEAKNPMLRTSLAESKSEAKRLKLRDLSPWERKYMRRMVLTYVIVYGLYIFLACSTLLAHQQVYLTQNNNSSTYSEATRLEMEKCRETAIFVECGTYVEGLSELSLRDGTYRISMEVWFSWDGEENLDMLNNFRIYQGQIESMTVLKDEHEDGMHFQRVRLSAVVQEDYWTSSFPLDSHELFCYIECNYPGSEVLLIPDVDCSSANAHLYVSGYKVNNVSMKEMYYMYENSHGDRDHEGTMLVSEVMTKVDISREGVGLYVKCFIALVGTITWVFIAMFINTYHHVDPLGMVPGALFGTVSNIMVGASLVPDSLRLGLLEYVNAFGILTILGVAMSIITVNRLRSKHRANGFAGLLGRVIFWTLLSFVLLGNILMPLVCVIG